MAVEKKEDKMRGRLNTTYEKHCVSLRNAKMTMLPCCYVTPLLLSNELMIRIPNPEEGRVVFSFHRSARSCVAFAALAVHDCFSGMRVALVSS